MLNFEEQLKKIHDTVDEGKSDIAIIDDDESFHLNQRIRALS